MPTIVKRVSSASVCGGYPISWNAACDNPPEPTFLLVSQSIVPVPLAEDVYEQASLPEKG
jgi:hypothetical protein